MFTTTFRSRKLILLLQLLFFIPLNSILAQNIPGINTLPAAVSVKDKPSPYSANAPLNYVRTWQPLIPMSAETAVMAGSSAAVQQSTQYVDGLGRLLQTVARGFAPIQPGASVPLDIVSPMVYDAFGRESYTYLPYTSSESNGSFKADPFGQQAAFMAAQYPGENVYYGHIEYESSPLNRVIKTLAPGNSWAGNNRGVATSYEVNTGAQEVVLWHIGTEEGAIPVSGGYYAAGELSRISVTDEKGKRIVEYKDKEGQIVLKKTEIAATAPAITEHDGWLCTYYIYDDLNLLRLVMPPLAVEGLAPTWNLSSQTSRINELCFQYAYDDRSRMTAKKVPGAGWMYMLYDNRDRQVFSQDANMRSRNWWNVTLYDPLNRPVQTGILTYNGNNGREILRDYLNTLSAGTNENTYSGAGSGLPEDLFVSQHDGRSVYKATRSIFFEEPFNGEEFEAQIVAANGQAFTSQQTIALDPVSPLPPGATGFIPLVFTYYDNYDWTNKTYNAAYNNKLGMGSNAYGEPLPSGTITETRTLITGTRIRVLEDADDLSKGAWLESVNFYDRKGRLVQVQSDNYNGSHEILTSRYDFTGNLISGYQVHDYVNGGTNQRTYTEWDYDHGGRLTAVRKTLNDDPATTRVIARNSYELQGQLKTKYLGQKTDAAGAVIAGSILETQDYNYTIRGWLKGMNWGGYNSGSTPSAAKSDRWFAMDLSYDWGYDKNQYDGNIAGIRWKSAGDVAERSFGYDYDPSSRLLLADFSQLNGNAWNQQTATPGNDINFNVKLGYTGTNDGSAYDANGNIKRLQQWGVIAGGGATRIDNLAYDYYDYSNKLRSVTDDPGAYHLGDFEEKNSGYDYGYDVNGNLVTDKNKRLNGTTDLDVPANAGAIQYNLLNLPWKVVMKDDAGNDRGSITYIYDATGNKLEKRTEVLANAANNQTARHLYTTYLNGYVYNNNVLQFFSHEEGRIRPKRNSAGAATGMYYYDYFVKDHLGSIRMILTDEQQTDAYPVAALETASLANERIYYDIPDAGRVLASTVPGHPAAGNANAYVQRLNGNGQKTGSSIVLKVMAGDKVNILADSWYAAGTTPQTRSNLQVADLIASLAGGITSAGAGNHSIAQLQQNANLQNGLGSFFTSVVNTDNALDGSTPKAYLNYVLFDEQFNVVITNDGKNSGADRVGEGGQLKPHSIANRDITRNGYLYVYVSNETSGLDVVFDNLQVTQVRGPLIEETHYYPFGLTMKGISSVAAGSLENRKKYNGIELNDDFDINVYDAFYRNLDPQIGRWWQVDPKVENMEMWGVYVSNYDNPIRFSDILGDEGGDPTKKGFFSGLRDGFVGTFTSLAHAVTNPVQTLKAIASKEGVVSILKAGSIMGMTEQAFGVAKSVYNGDTYAVGTAVGEAGAQVALGLATEGVGRAVGEVATSIKAGLKASLKAEVATTVETTAVALKAAKKGPAAVVGAIAPDADVAIATSGGIPGTIAPKLEARALETVGPIGTKVGNTTVGCCAEFQGANKLMLKNQGLEATQIVFTDALRPSTQAVVPPCAVCEAMFNIKK